MDFQRYALIGAIILIGFILLTEWDQFRQQRAQEAALTPTQMQSPAPDYSADLPGAEPAPDAADDIPQAQAAAESPADQPEPEQAAAHRITVNTDVLGVAIDLRGGDVIHAELQQHMRTLDSDQPLVLLESEPGGRLYVAQSGLIGPDGTDRRGEPRPLFQTNSQHYQLQRDERELHVDLRFTTDAGVKITKRFIFTRGDYLVRVQYLIDNGSSKAWDAQLYAQLKRDSSPDPGGDTGQIGVQPFLGVATRTTDDPYIKQSFKDLQEKPLQTEAQAGWIAIVQHYFISAWVPDREQTYTFTAQQNARGINIARVLATQLSVAPGEQGSVEAGLYIGPKDQYRLEEIAPGLDLTVDYGFLWWLAQPLFWVLYHIQSVLINWGWSIIVLTVFIKILFFQLNAKAFKSMANMRRIQPKFQEIRERYGDDKQRQSQEMMKLYQKEKVNPLGGCLPILLQMPVFLALYWMLLESVELRHAPWVLWIQDLSSKDPTFVLPLIMGATMYFQQKLNPPPPDPMQAKIMQWMPVMFTFFFLWFPSGLVLYYVVNNLLSMLQQYIITKKVLKE